MFEIWKTLEENTAYQISNLGNVKSLNYNNTGVEKVLKGIKQRDGYLRFQVKLSNGKTKSVSIHRLVGKYFIDNPLNKPYINHINGIKNDNRAINLEWVTGSENNFHSYNVLNQIPPMLNKYGKNHVSSKAVICDATGEIYESLKATAEKLGVTSKMLGYHINKKGGNKYNLRYINKK